MSLNRTLNAARLREVLDYEPETGIFRWKVTDGGIAIGTRAGTLNGKGYRHLRIGHRSYMAHRLVWLHVHGVWPDRQVDHINGARDDNRLANLRLATNAQNCQNSMEPLRGNRSGLRGVSAKRGRWSARIGVDGRVRHLGEFATPEEAYVAYLAAKRELHPFWAQRGVQPIATSPVA